MDKNKTNINWYPGHMAKTKREIQENINLIDVVYEVIDARMPISSKIADIDSLIQEKPRILIVTKYDLCDKNRTNTLLKTYEKKDIKIVPVDLINGNGVSKIIQETLAISEELNAKRKERGMKARRIRALVVGVPNVGKSTLINQLVRKKATVVGNRPGVTKSLGWVRIHPEIELLDSPGILWPKIENQENALNLAALSSIREEILPLDEVSLHILLKMSERYPIKLEERYSLRKVNIENFEESLKTIAQKRGALLKGGAVDYEKVYRIIISDLKDGSLGKITFD